MSFDVGANVQIGEWRPDSAAGASLDHEIDMLADVLREVVYDGAGVSFVVPFSHDDARSFWTDKVLPGVRAGTRRVLLARTGNRIVGTVQMDLATPPNQVHRAEVAKLLVHPIARRQGVARALMIELERVALSAGKSLLTLDTWTGGNAEALYRSLGYVVVGVIPRFARGSTTPELEPTTIMYKELGSAECGVRSAECEVRSAKCGVRSAECGVRSAECEALESAVRPPREVS